MHDLIDQRVIDSAAELAARFARREPFRHIVIDGFFRDDYARTLLAKFPAFESGNARNEAGELGGKSVVEKIHALGGEWAALDDTIQTPAFLALISRVTGIPDLIYDPWYFGGGTHDNREGQDLDPHVDFNRHPVERWHRRLNLIVYLNLEWNDNWGGSLELHSNPRAPDDQITLVTPTFNRCVIFETTEWSWHGFSRIALPPDRRELTRKSVALYFYTLDRPADELADTHSTIYVNRPLPEHLHPGHVLTEADMEQLRVMVTRRDQHNERLYRDLTQLNAQLEQATAALQAGRLGRLRYFARRMLARLQGSLTIGRG